MAPKKDKKKSNRRNTRRRKSCPFCTNPSLEIDYKNVDVLSRFISDRGKIAPRRNSGVCAKHQRRLTKEIKKARFLALIPYVIYTYR